MALQNAYFKGGNLTNAGAGALNTGMNLANPFLQTGYRDDNAWNTGAVGSTGFSDALNTGGQIAGQFGPIGAGIQGGAQAIGSMADLFSYSPEVQSIKTGYGSDQLPTFDLSDEASSLRNFKEDFNESANKKIASATLGGAVTGTTIAPGLGTAIGAITGFTGSLIGKSQAKKRAEEAEQKMTKEYSSAIDSFNTSTGGYYGMENAREKYQANKQAQRNLFNIPSSTPYFYLG